MYMTSAFTGADVTLMGFLAVEKALYHLSRDGCS